MIVSSFVSMACFHSMLSSSPGDIDTWTGAIDTDLTNPGNWDTFNVPTAGSKCIFDNTAANFTPTLSASSTSNSLDTDTFQIDTSTPVQYSFFIQDSTNLNFDNSFFNPSGVMVTNRLRNPDGTPVAPVQNFYITNGGQINFFKQSEADIGIVFADYQLPPFIVYNLGNTATAGFVNFEDSSRAGSAGYLLQNGSKITFDRNSNAELAQIHAMSNSLVYFTSTSTGGGTIVDAIDSTVLYDLGASAFFSIYNLNHSALNFTQGSDLFSATITANNNSSITIQDGAVCIGSASMQLNDSIMNVKNFADTGHLDITANNSHILYQDSAVESGGGNIILTNNSSISFFDSSSAGLTRFKADNSTITFGNFNDTFTFPNSDRAIVTLDNHSVLTFNNSASLLELHVLDASSVINFNNFLSTPMLFGPTAIINNGDVHINPYGPSAFGPVVLIDAFNTYPSGTVHRGTLIGNSLSIVGNWNNFGEIVFNQTIQQQFFGSISGPGNVIVQSGGTLILDSGHFIQSPSIHVIGPDTMLQSAPNLLQGDLTIDEGTVDFEVSEDDFQEFSGLITGNSSPENETIAINKSGGEGVVLISNPNNNYLGETVVYGGTLLINNGLGIPGELKIKNQAGVVFNQLVDGPFVGVIEGNGIAKKIGSAKLIFSANKQNFLQSLAVLQGEFQLDGELTSPTTTVALGSVLSGSGTLTGDLEIFGSFAPSGPATFTVRGDLEFEPGSTYQLQVDGASSSLVDVKRPTEEEDSGNITLEGGTVAVTLINGNVDTCNTYTILSAEGVLTGQFSAINSNDPLLRAILTYDSQHAFLQMCPTLQVIGRSFNQRQVANQLDGGGCTGADTAAFVLELVSLTDEQARDALNQMSAMQYTQAVATAEVANQRFIRRLFDPIREAVTIGHLGNQYCGEVTRSSWMDISYDHTDWRGNKNALGVRTNGFDVSGGVQAQLNSQWTLGIAGFYEEDHLHFDVGGSGKNHTGLGGVYALYRPCNYYVFADLAIGLSHQHIRRPIEAGSFQAIHKGNPHLFQGAFYGEIGIDLDTKVYLQPWIGFVTIQPFFGLEVDYVRLKKIRERCDDFLAVEVFHKKQTTTHSRLGVHFTTKPTCRSFLSIDLAWQYRMNALRNSIEEKFITCCDSFAIEGIHHQRNSVDGAVTWYIDLPCGWQLYAEAAGQKWENSSEYNLLAGFTYTW